MAGRRGVHSHEEATVATPNRGIGCVASALEVHDRVSAIMACGTGKTLIALWVAERMQANSDSGACSVARSPKANPP